ncbi:MAG: hypothetical protein WAW11_04720 [Patescibacteria group bacterium]
MISSFFVNSSSVVNRAPTVSASEMLNGVLAKGGCQCVNCVSCNNSCNK